MLHRNGSSVDLEGHYKRTPLHSAACWGDSEIVQVLLDCNLDVNARSDFNQTPLHFALEYWTPGHFKAVRLLLENGADPNARESDGSTPLHVASEFGGTVQVARLLLKYGADVDALDRHSRTAFQVASVEGRDEMMKFLSAYGAKGIS